MKKCLKRNHRSFMKYRKKKEFIKKRARKIKDKTNEEKNKTIRKRDR